MFKWFKKYFIPHESNDYKPHFLRHETITIFFLAIIVIELGFLVQVFIVFDKTKFLASVLPGVLTSLTNEARAENNLPALSESPLLAQAARLKAEDMASRGYFAHTSPNGVTPWHWLSEVGYRYGAAGENLAVNFFESEDVTRAWMDSPTHRANIVRGDFTEIGIGVASGIYQGRNTIFVAQFFGKPIPVYQAPATVVSAPPAPVPAPRPAPSLIPPPAPFPVPSPTGVAVTPSPLAPETVEVLGSEAPVTSEQKPSQNPIKKSLERTLTSPRQSVSYVYLGVALLLILAILLTFFVRIERQHPAFLAKGLALFAVVVLLLFVDMRVHNYKTLVPSNLSANVIYATP